MYWHDFQSSNSIYIYKKLKSLNQVDNALKTEQDYLGPKEEKGTKQ